MLLTNALPTKEYYSTNQGYQDCRKPLISLIGKLPTKFTNRGDLVGWWVPPFRGTNYQRHTKAMGITLAM